MIMSKRAFGRGLAVLLTFVMLFCMVPTNAEYATAYTNSALETNLESIDFVVGETAEFTVTSTANDDAGTMVKGSFVFSDPSAIGQLEYYETTPGYEGWYELAGEFGPETGFPIIDGTSKFRVAFSKAGDYTVDIVLKDVNTQAAVCSTQANVSVARNASTLTTDISAKNFVVFSAAEFTVTSVANDDADKLVKGSFVFSDPSAIGQLEYYETTPGYEGWYELAGEFGPETGFPVINGTSKFRVAFNKAGDYTVDIALKQVSDGTTLCSVTTTVSVAKTDITDVAVSGTTNVYDGAAFPLVSLEGIQEDDVVTYVVNGEPTDAPEGVNAGNYAVTVTVDRGANYNPYVQSVTATIALGDLNLGALKVQGLESVYNGAAQEAVIVTDQGDYSLQYKLGEGEWSDIIPTVTDAGSYTVYVKAIKNNYHDKDVDVELAASAVLPYNVYVAKADQTGFGFEDTPLAPLPFNATLTHTAAGGQSDGAITYEVVEGADYVTVDENGVITAIKANGTAAIRATRAGNDNYNDASANYTISTIKADQSDFAFEQAEYSVQYGTAQLNVVALGGQSKGAVTYEVISGDLGAVASVDNGGVITFASGKKGEMTIKATLDGGENYNDIAAEAVVKVLTNDFSDKVNVPACPATGWYTDTVIITPAEGYQISTSAQFDAAWSDTMPVMAEGQNGIGNVYLKELATGYISEAVAIEPIFIDKTDPTALEITYSTSIRDVILEAITFGFYDADMTVTLTATDLISKIDHFGYKIGDGEECTIPREQIDSTKKEDGTVATASFSLSPELSRSKITFIAYDAAGRSTEILGDKALVVDATNPVVSVSYDNNNAVHDAYFNADRTVTIAVAEENFFKDALYDVIPGTETKYMTITVGTRLDGDEDYTYTHPELPFDLDGGVYKATYTFSENADYIFDVQFYDYSENANVSVNYGTSVAPFAFTVDKVNPVVEISYDDTNAVSSQTNEGYFKGEREMILTVTEHNFDPSELEFTEFFGTNVAGDKVATAEIMEMIGYFKDPASWSREGDVSVAKHAVTADANYTIKLNYSDLAGNAAAEQSDAFCLDNAKPYVLADTQIKYSTSIWDTVLTAISFGFYNSDVTVEITAYDETAGIDYFTYSYIVDYSNDQGRPDDEGHPNDTGVINGIITRDQINFSDGGKTATATFTIPRQFRGYVQFTANDKSDTLPSMFKDTPGEWLFVDEKILVVDDEASVVTVTYDNDDVLNGEHYKGDRTATITISADNFFPELLYTPVEGKAGNENHLVITVGTQRNDQVGYEFTHPQPTFTKSGNVYVAQIPFTEDSDYTFDIKYTDASLNVSEKYETDIFTVDKTAPIVDVEWTEPPVANGNRYRGDRYATITIKEHNFDAKDVEVTVTADNAQGEVFDYVGYLTDTTNWTPVAPDTYETTIPFSVEAEYTFDIKYTDLAGNVYDAFDKVDFIIDKTAPTGSVQIGTWTKSVDGTEWNAFPEGDDDNRSFGALSTNKAVTVTIHTDDVLSGVDIVKHFRSDKILTLEEVKAATEWIDVTESKNTFSYDVEPDEQFVVYLHIVDMAGNEHYVSSDGVILDKTLPDLEKVAPEIIIEPADKMQPINGIYNTDVPVDVKVVDPTEQGTFSGLQSITYKVYKVNATGEKIQTQEGELLTFDKTSGEALVDLYDELACITVDRELNNSNMVIVEVTAVDNAGNVNADTCTIMLDITAPVIDVAYDNNKVDSAVYFDAVRKATIKISERNFKNEDVMITVTHTDDNGVETKTVVTPNFTVEMDGDAPKVYTWDGEGRDGSEYYVYTMEYLYDKDGDYKFEIEYADLAGNRCTEKNFAADTAPGTEYAFTLDMTKPVIGVTYDNNSARNGNYYKTDRIATIVITEHNLDPNGVDKDRIVITVTASDDGREIAAPVETTWTTNGNDHTATIHYGADGLYSFDIAVKDKAGNDSVDYAAETFYVDKTNPAVSITEIVDESANNDEGDIGFVIMATDTNFDGLTPVLSVTDITGVSRTLDVGSFANIKNGQTFTVKNLDADGIYRITCTVVDKAGNAFSEITLQDAEGSSYVENRNGEDTLVTFSVNRDGSTYEINADTADLIKKYYVQNVLNNVVIVETNADPLTEYAVTLNGKELTEETDYTVTEEGGNGQWMKYTYTVNKDLFTAEGEYKLVVSSKDKATNDAFSDVKDATVNFVVDRTAPIVTITGMAKDGRYQTESQKVTLVPTDDGGALKTLIVRFVDEEGNVMGEPIIDWTGEALEKALENGEGKIEFTIDEGMYQNIQIICTDCAVDEDGKTNMFDETITNVTVTPNGFMIFWADPTLRWGSIIGVCVLAAAIVLFVILQKKKAVKQ